MLLAMFAVGIWSGFARDRQRAEAQKEAAAYADNEWTEAFDPADYPDYVPLDGQVETLRSLGFSITEQLADRVRGVMEDDMTRVYVEGYPYTWLLTELGVLPGMKTAGFPVIRRRCSGLILKAGISATIIRRCWRECWRLPGTARWRM